MFRRRLTWCWVLLTGITIVILARLTQIQVLQAAQYELLAEALRTRPDRLLPAPRGTIFDRRGTPLLSDVPAYDVCLHYAVLSDDDTRLDEYLYGVARARRQADPDADPRPLRHVVAELREDVAAMWPRLARLAGLGLAELEERAAEVRARVAAIRAHVQQRSPRVRRIAEENDFLPLLSDLDNAAVLAIRLEFRDQPWLRVVPGSRRVAHEADVLAHVLGRLGAAAPDRIAQDPLAADPLRRLRPGDRCGVSGLERAAELSLRGTRGRIVEERDGRILERTAPVRGRDVYLTLDLEWQRAIYDVLGEAVENAVHPAGAAAVVIDVTTREVRALVSYPAYTYDRFSRDYASLRDDRQHLPLLFRAVGAQYPPGSICKAITLVGGLSEGVIRPDERIHCTGYLLENNPTRFRCWIYNQNPGVTHDMLDSPAGQDAESAIRNSCNIYFYRLGERLGPARLCAWFERFGLGRTQGTGLIEESPAIVPHEDWLRRTAGRGFQESDAWNFAIGQGEVTITPLQAANVAATIAAGFWAPVRLATDARGQAIGAPLAPSAPPLDERHLQVLRRGLWRVVNEPQGTGYHARLARTDVVLCGKTGSAQTVPRVISQRYTLEWPDGRRAEVVAGSESEALAGQPDPPPEIVGRRVHETFPQLLEGEALPSHAWFIGFTQAADTPPGAAPRGPVYALSVIIEFGGSGGRVAGPVAKRIVEYILDHPE